jgi:hypothetical protein
MKRTLLVLAALAALPLAAHAEPIAFEQAANVTGLAGIEVGANVDYAYEKVEQNGVTLNETTLMDVPVFVRAGIPILEGKLTLPFGTVKSNVPNVQAQDFSGIRDLGVMVKSALLTLPVFSFALGVDTTFPTGDPLKYLGEGLNLDPFAAADIDLLLLKLHANLGFRYRAEYSVESTSGGVTQSVKLNPGDAMHFALGLEIPAGEMFSLHAELLGANYGEATSGGIPIPDSAGTLLSVVPGVRLKAGPLKAKLGVQIPIEAKDSRPSYAPTADWRVLGGVSLQFSL